MPQKMWGEMMELNTARGFGYKCPDCDWTTKYQYRNAKKAFKRHWMEYHHDEKNKREEVEEDLLPGEESKLDDLLDDIQQNHRCDEHTALLSLKKVIDQALEG